MSGSHVTVTIRYPDGRTEPRMFQQGSYTIGREVGDIVLGDAKSSSSHARMDVQADRVVITDLGSTNGTFSATGERLTGETPMEPGGPVRIGDCTLTLGTRVTAKGTMVALEAPPTPDYLRPSAQGAASAPPAASTQVSAPQTPPAAQTRMPAWAAGVLGAVALMLVLWGVTALGGEANIAVECQVSGLATMQCILRNEGDADGGGCVDVRVVCSDGDHVANEVCTETLSPGGYTTKAVRLSPPIGIFVGMAGCSVSFGD